MTKYKACIGLEMHCEISETNSKVFSSAKNCFNDVPNSNIRPVDMAFPGTLPVVNKEAIKKALMASIILECQQPEYIYFERKNYYYPDLPKGFQITQETKPIPIGIYGKVVFACNQNNITVRVNNVHLEEDSASLDHGFSTSAIDYNRAGVPLLELVTEPDLHSAEEAVAFLEYMRKIYQFAGISEADSKKGQIRCDVNISIMDEELSYDNYENYGTKVEIKLINSFGGVRDAINYEIDRQIKLKNNGQYDEMIQQTRRWDEETGTTKFMRSKVDAIDYKYFVEPNIPKYKLTAEWITEIKNSIPKLATERKTIYTNEYGLSDYDATVILKDRSFADYFEECLNLECDPKIAANWLITQILGQINKDDILINDFFITPPYLKQIIMALNKGIISSKQAKEIFFKAIEEKKEPKEFINEENSQLSDTNELNNLIEQILSNNLNQLEAYHNGKTNLFDFFVGQVMKETHGKANPIIVKELLTNKLKK